MYWRFHLSGRTSGNKWNGRGEFAEHITHMRMQGRAAILQEAIEKSIYYWSRRQRQMFASSAHTRFNHCGCVAMCRVGLMDCSAAWVEFCGINIRGPDSDWMPCNVWGLMCSLVNSALCFLKMWEVIIADPVCLNCADNVDLGTACGKYFRVSSLSITDPGDSDIIKTQDPQA